VQNMGKSYINLTPKDWEVLSFAREVPYFNGELIREVFWGGKSTDQYVRRKLSHLISEGYIKGWSFPGLKKFYSITSKGAEFFRMISGSVKYEKFRPNLNYEFLITKSINTYQVHHTIEISKLKFEIDKLAEFENVVVYDNCKDKKKTTELLRPDLLIKHKKFSIFVEYEATKKDVNRLWEKANNYLKIMPKPLILVLYICKDGTVLDDLFRCYRIFRGQGEKKYKGDSRLFRPEEFTLSERFYFGLRNDMVFKNCLGKEIDFPEIFKRISK